MKRIKYIIEAIHWNMKEGTGNGLLWLLVIILTIGFLLLFIYGMILNAFGSFAAGLFLCIIILGYLARVSVKMYNRY